MAIRTGVGRDCILVKGAGRCSSTVMFLVVVGISSLSVLLVDFLLLPIMALRIGVGRLDFIITISSFLTNDDDDDDDSSSSVSASASIP